MAFESLSEKLQGVFKNLRSKGRLTEDDVKNHIFVSNTTLDGLKEKYPDLKSAFPDLLTEDTTTIINCNKM